MIDAVVFDADQTLWAFDVPMRRALAATLEELRALLPDGVAAELDVDILAADREVVAARLAGVEVDLAKVRRAAFAYSLGRVGLRDPALVDHLTGVYLEHRNSGVELFPDVQPALAALRGRYRLGLLSNGNGDPARHGLGDAFDAVVFAHEHGHAKPDRRIFDITAGMLGVAPGRIAMVGDSLVDDVAGAQGAGWRALWLDRAGEEGVPGIVPDGVVSGLDEVPAALDALAGGLDAPASR